MPTHGVRVPLTSSVCQVVQDIVENASYLKIGSASEFPGN